MQLPIRGTVVMWLALTSSTWAAEYNLRFGELQPPDNKILVPTKTIKLCERSTGYRYQLVDCV